MNGLVVRRLDPADAEAFRTIRLEALERHPENFCVDIEQERAALPEAWHERLGASHCFGGYVGEKMAGIAGLSRPCTMKLAHIAEFGGMYVRPDYRGSGLADRIVEAAIAAAHEARSRAVKLHVNAENITAIRLYARHGFVECGRLPGAVHVGDRYYDEVTMVRALA